MSKTTRKVTVDTSRRSSGEGVTSSIDSSTKVRKKSVFERLGTSGATASYEQDLCRTFARDSDYSYGNNSKISDKTDMKKHKKDKYNESDDGGYQDLDRSPESKRDKRKIQDGERLKIEFKKDTVLKKKQTISELYEEEVPMRKMKKEREKKDRELHALPKLKMNEDVTVTKDEHVRSIQLKGEEKRERKSKFERKEDDDSPSDATVSKKHKKKRKHEESEEDLREKAEAAPKKKKKKKDKNRYESSNSESDSEKEKKKKSKKDKYKSYDSEDSGNEALKKKSKGYDYEEVEDRRILTEMKKKKKKRKEKYESESDVSSGRELFYAKKEKMDKDERGHEGEKSKKSRKTGEEDFDSSKKKKNSDGKKQKYSPTSRKESQKGKEKLRRSASYSSLSSGSSLGEEEEEEENDDYQRRNKKGRDQEYRDEKKNKGRKRDKRQEERSSQMQEDTREIFVDDRKKDAPVEGYQREHYSHHQEPRHEHWERDRPAHEQPSQYGSPYYGRSRGPEQYRGRYEHPAKGSSDRDRPGYRQYQDGGYGSDPARYRDRGTRDPYPYQRRGGYPGEEEGFAAGRSRDTYAGAPEQGFAREEKQGQRHRNYSGSKGDQDELDERGRRKSGHRGSRERKDYGSRSPVSKRKSRSPREVGRDDSKDRSKSKKRKREEESPPPEKEQSIELKNKKSKGDTKSESEVESGGEGEQRIEKNRKNVDDEKREGGRRTHKESEGHQKRDDFVDEKRERRTDRSKGREKDRERGGERDRDRDRRSKPGFNADRSRGSKIQSRSDKRGDTPSNEENRNDKAEDKRLSSLKAASHRHSSPSRRSDSDSGSKSQRRRGRSGQDDVNLDDVYEKISDDELDFFDEDSSKANKPASLEDLDWSALAAIAPPSKKDSEEGQSHRSKHSAINILKSIGFSPNLLREEALKKIRQKFAETADQENELKEPGCDLGDFESGTAAFVANKIKITKHRRNLIANLATQGTVLSMRKDINLRKELRIPPNRLPTNYSLYCNAPSAPADKELFLASAALYKKIAPGEDDTSCKIIPSLVGSVIECAN